MNGTEAKGDQGTGTEFEGVIPNLQRRFEMAVEDLRHLKQENATLREQAERVPQGAAAAVDDAAGGLAGEEGMGIVVSGPGLMPRLAQVPQLLGVL